MVLAQKPLDEKVDDRGHRSEYIETNHKIGGSSSVRNNGRGWCVCSWRDESTVGGGNRVADSASSAADWANHVGGEGGRW